MIQQIKPKKKGNQKWINFAYLGAVLAAIMPLILFIPAILLGLYYCTPQFDNKTRSHGLSIITLGLLSGAFGMWVHQAEHNF